MALILKYRIDPPEALNAEVFEALAAQVGKVGINMTLPLVEDDPEKVVLQLRGDFISIEGEHFAQAPERRRPDESPFRVPDGEQTNRRDQRESQGSS